MYFEKDSQRGIYATFTWLVEEVGELAEALLSNDSDSIQEELADVIAWTVSIANLKGIDIEEALKKKYKL
ncbi:putative pyrophosphatase [Sulfolobus islandicus LAL14/1]|nr:putative pyrophosphatase [Sulfolobus islandicus LAL14/1]